MIYCYNCERFGEPEQVLEWTGVTAPDGTKELYTAEVCQHCGSDEIEEAKTCKLCGCEMIPSEEEDYCDACVSEIYSRFEEICESLHNDYGDENRKSIVDCMEVAFEKWYGDKTTWIQFEEMKGESK